MVGKLLVAPRESGYPYLLSSRLNTQSLHQGHMMPVFVYCSTISAAQINFWLAEQVFSLSSQPFESYYPGNCPGIVLGLSSQPPIVLRKSLEKGSQNEYEEFWMLGMYSFLGG